MPPSVDMGQSQVVRAEMSAARDTVEELEHALATLQQDAPQIADNLRRYSSQGDVPARELLERLESSAQQLGQLATSVPLSTVAVENRRRWEKAHL